MFGACVPRRKDLRAWGHLGELMQTNSAAPESEENSVPRHGSEAGVSTGWKPLL